MIDLEILAPVGDEKNFFTAINNGADAVYLGLKNFNARDKAENFNCENIRSYVEFAHLFGVKVYVTINIILTNNELPLLLDMVKKCIESKVDAFIVQDLGVGYLLKNTFKKITLHASTQMGIHNLQGAKIAEKMGFSRIVVSRETSKEDIIEIKKNTNLEIEYFVQGALCVCFSGNCYYSSLEKNESGNRGRCLQLCRLPHTAIKNNEKVNKGYLLSTTDLCLLEKVKELISLGICSLKIEGRLRRSAYVGYTTSIYAQAKTLLQQNKKVEFNENLETFKKLFYRGEYNKGIYLNEINNKHIINTQFQNHRGVLIGRVLNVEKFKDIYKILIATNGYIINKNDGLKFIYNNNEISLGVGSVQKSNRKNEYVIFSKAKPIESSEVYLTLDNNWEKQCNENKRTLCFDAYFEAKIGKKPLLKLNCNGVEISQVLFENCQKAINQSVNYIQVKECLEKVGNEPFNLRQLTCNIENVFILKSSLNELRRKALEVLKQKVIENFEQKNNKKIECGFSFFENNKDKLDFCINKNFNKFIVVNEKNNFANIDLSKWNIVFSPTLFTLDNIIFYLQKIQDKTTSKIYLDLPKVLRKEDFAKLEEILKSLDNSKIGLVANNIYGLSFINLGYEVIGGVYLNIANNFTAKFLLDLGIKNFVKSFEQFASDFSYGLTFIGKPALMTFCHCPYKTTHNYSKCEDCKFAEQLIYKNQSGKEMSIRRIKIKNCYFEMLSSTSINLQEQNKDNIYLDLRN